MSMSVRQKQWQLYFLGYYGGNIDGIWGSQSKSATVSFQRDNSLSADGIFGSRTEGKSIVIVKNIQEVVGANVDGFAGPETKAKTITWQKANGLTADGIAGPKTRAKIEELSTVNEEDDSWWSGIKYFNKSEFKCKCGGRYCNGYPAEPNKLLIQNADKVRAHFGAPAFVSSGVRCEVHNKNVGGVSGSRHKLGKAMDFCISGKNSNQVLAYVKKLPDIRYCYAIDAYYVHMDVY